MERLRVAVIGVGNMGRHHARIYSTSLAHRCDLVAVSDVSEERRNELIPKTARFYRDYLEMIRKEDLDAVSIAVPTSAHCAVATDCLGAGLHVLLEKPIAGTVAEGRKIISAARRSGGKRLMIGHIERFNVAVRNLKQLLDKGKIGTPLSMLARRVGVWPPQIKDASVIIDLAVHDIDIMNYLTGRRPDRVFANAGRTVLADRDDYAEIFLRYGRTAGMIQVNWITPVKIRTLSVTGSKGYAEVDYLQQTARLFEPLAAPPNTYSDFAEFTRKYMNPTVSTFSNERSVEPLFLELDHFVSACLDPAFKMESDGESALVALDVAVKAAKIASR